jgi:hypothetical protein
MVQDNSISPEISKRIVDLLRAGVSIKGAMRAVGKSERSYHRWQQYGKEERSPLYVSFLKATREARGDIECRMVDLRRNKAERGDNESIDKLLKQVNREAYQDRLIVEQEIEKFMSKLKEGLPDEVYQQVLDIATEE